MNMNVHTHIAGSDFPCDRSKPVMHDIWSQFHKGYWTDVIGAYKHPHAIGWQCDEPDSLELKRVLLATETRRRRNCKCSGRFASGSCLTGPVKNDFDVYSKSTWKLITLDVKCQSVRLTFFDRRVNDSTLLAILCTFLPTQL